MFGSLQVTEQVPVLLAVEGRKRFTILGLGRTSVIKFVD